jgi:hypothetical protein
MPFHNPYHFVPVTGQGSPDGLLVTVFQAGDARHVTHDRYIAHTNRGGQPVYSGRLICRLTTEDPIVIGHTREALPDGSHRVEPFELPSEGRPAIPASTLRGLISSVAEAASNSAMRVLEDGSLSYRMSMEHSLSAIGMIVKIAGEYQLRPLALPTMEGPPGGAVLLPEPYRKMFPLNRTPPLKVYVGDEHTIRSDAFVSGLPLRTFSRDDPQFCYAQLHPRQWHAGHTLPHDPFQHRKGGATQEYLLSQTTVDGLPPQLEDALPASAAAPLPSTRGILRILGVPGRDDIPTTKKHELFIPYPDDIENVPPFPIMPEAIARFYRLADERTEARKEGAPLPYEPQGTVRNRQVTDAQDKSFRLKDGDLVYFRPNRTGDAVEEIALSAIWRRSAGTTYDYFRRLSLELLPFHRGRQVLSIAEQLFGFVEQRQRGQHEETLALALASRLRFAFGRLHPVPEGPYYDVEDEDGIPLKVLDTPKPPMPAFYFKARHGRGRYIAKSDLSPDSHVPQGRKFYLHKPERAIHPWETYAKDENLKQKSRVRPIQAGLSFYFHVDFDNVSERELGLLCYAIRPTEAFRHKIGMGKPLGLGKVRLDPVGVFYIDRLQRYQETSLFDACRYHAGWLGAGENPQNWPDLYARERQEGARGLAAGQSFEALRALFVETMDKDIARALELLGDPEMVRYNMHTPQIADARQPREMEQETYRWFVANDQNRRPQFLEPLTRDTDELPTLER